LILKSDSYVVESNIHFPTDIGLAWDSARKCNDVICLLQRSLERKLEGWRNHNVWRKKSKNKYKVVSDIHSRRGGNYESRMRKSVEDMLDYYRKYSNKIKNTLEELKGESLSLISEALCAQLKNYHNYLDLFIDQMDRRLLKGEKIPHNEKVFSIFEPHAEWIKKGKSNNRVELGHNVLITTDQYHFIVDHKVMVNQRDNAQPFTLMERLKENYPIHEYIYESLSFDRGFYSWLAKVSLSKEVAILVLPKKGKKTKAETEEESRKDYRQLRNRHSAVESNINELEQGGVNKVPDKGLEGFKKYVALGVLANNIKRLGKYLKEQRA